MARASNLPTLESITAEINDLAERTEAYITKLEEEGDMPTMLVAFYRLKDGYKALDEARKRIYKQSDYMDKNLLPQLFEKRDIDKMQVASIAKSFYPLTKYSASVKDKDTGYDWLREAGLGAIITETVNAGTLASSLKEYIAETGKEPDPEVIEFKTYYSTGISSYTPKD